jgi:anti-sigma B factor antagonist
MCHEKRHFPTAANRRTIKVMMGADAPKNIFNQERRMDITEREQNGITIFVLEGRVDSEGAVDLDLALQAATSENKDKLVLDMSQVRYINSAGLRTLADILTQCKESEGDLKLVDLNPKVQRVFQIIGFDKFFSIYSSVENALADF